MNSKLALLLLISVGYISAQGGLPSTPAILDVTCVDSLKPLFQGNCSSDYAVIAAAAVELGWCLKDTKNAEFKGLSVSAQDIMCKCTACHSTPGNACGGGKIEEALKYLTTGGVGGSYPKQAVNTKTSAIVGGPTNYKDCLNYWTDVCDPSEETACVYTPYDLSKSATYCPPTDCNRQSTIKLADAQVTNFLKTHPKKNTAFNLHQSLSNQKPLVGTMEIYEDMEFFLGTEMIYTHTSGQSLGVVNVIIVGFEVLNSQPFWTVLVPWDKKWDLGIKAQKLRVIANINHLNIENEAFEINVTA